MMQRRRAVTLALTLAATSFFPGITWAQTANTKPLRLIVPFAPGGATDITARALQEPLQRLLGRTVIVENKAGAGGSIGMAEVARSAADGLTLGVATLSTHGVNPAVYAKLPYDPVDSFVGVAEVVKAPGILVINPRALPDVRDVPTLVQKLQAAPGSIAYASPGTGTIGHMWGEIFQAATRTRMLHVPYKGSGPALSDVLGGQIAVYFDQVASSLPHVQSGKLRALAVSWHERLPMLADVPTYAELGLAAANDPSWFGIVAPAATPAAEVSKIQQAIAQALQEDGVKARLSAQGLYPTGSSSAEFSQQIVREIAKMKKVATDAHIQLD